MLELSLSLLGLAFSAFFSATELAFISANPLQIEVWSRQNRRGSGHALQLFRKPEDVLVSVLVGTTLANVIATSFATTYLLRHGLQPVLALVLITTTILLFGEILPKTLSGERPNHFLRIMAPPQRLWQILLAPIAMPLRILSDHYAPAHRTDHGSTRETTLEREDLKLLFAGQKNPRVLPQSEKELISQVFDLRETPVSKAMTPRTAIKAVSEADELESVIHTLIESGYSKLPVYRENLDQIVGVVYLYDLFKDPTDLASIIHPITLVPDSNTTMDVLRQLQRAHHAIAIVLDEYGGTAGLVTPEDLFEELFGEFEDEFDTDISASARLPDGSIITDGRMKVEDLNREYQLNIPEGDYETIAGYLTAALDRIPHKGERIYLPFGQIVIKKSTPRQIEQVQIHPPAGPGLTRRD
ncbi:MAG: HlyC/CorC family transporter [Fidelibacterota bacterium]|nr:MAG: HlyC/CorC family transporter [Candidatus Neomarinimicrobiota bacterium]